MFAEGFCSSSFSFFSVTNETRKSSCLDCDSGQLFHSIWSTSHLDGLPVDVVIVAAIVGAIPVLSNVRELTERILAVCASERASRRRGLKLEWFFWIADPMSCEVSLLKHHLQTIDLSPINWKQTPGHPITWCSYAQHDQPSRFHLSNPLHSLIALSWHIEQDFFCQQHERVGIESISKCFDTCCKCNWPFLNRLWSICWTLQLPI